MEGSESHIKLEDEPSVDETAKKINIELKRMAEGSGRGRLHCKPQVDRQEMNFKVLCNVSIALSRCEAIPAICKETRVRTVDVKTSGRVWKPACPLAFGVPWQRSPEEDSRVKGPHMPDKPYKHDTNVKFGPLSVAPETTRARWKYRSYEYGATLQCFM